MEASQEKNKDKKEPSHEEEKKADETQKTKEKTEEKEDKDEDYEKIKLDSIKKDHNPGLIQKLLYLNKLNSDKDEEDKKNFDVQEKIVMKKYDQQYDLIYAAVADIVSGKTLPQNSAQEKKDYNLEEEKGTPELSPIKDYWEKVIINSKYFTVNDKDKEILKFIKLVKLNKKEKSDDFTAEFIFEANDYFSNDKLTKEYIFQKGEVKKAIGTEIQWKSEGKNPTKQKKIIKGKKGKGHDKKVVHEKVESFFNFFNDKEHDDVTFLEDEVTFFNEDLFKNQLEYYLNIMEIGGDSFDEDEEEEDEEEEEEEEKKHGKKQKNKHLFKSEEPKKSDKADQQKNQECKNQ